MYLIDGQPSTQRVFTFDRPHLLDNCDRRHHHLAYCVGDHNLEQKFARIQANFPLRSRRDCLDTLEIANDDVEKAIAFLTCLGSGVPGIQIQTQVCDIKDA